MEKIEYLKALIDIQRFTRDTTDTEKRIVRVCDSIEKDLDIKSVVHNG